MAAAEARPAGDAARRRPAPRARGSALGFVGRGGARCRGAQDEGEDGGDRHVELTRDLALHLYGRQRLGEGCVFLERHAVLAGGVDDPLAEVSPADGDYLWRAGGLVLEGHGERGLPGRGHEVSSPNYPRAGTARLGAPRRKTTSPGRAWASSAPWLRSRSTLPSRSAQTVTAARSPFTLRRTCTGPSGST